MEFSTDHASGQLREGDGPYVFAAEIPEDRQPGVQIVLKVANEEASVPCHRGGWAPIPVDFETDEPMRLRVAREQPERGGQPARQVLRGAHAMLRG